MRNIGIFIFECLPNTETFIYEAINNLRNFKPHIFTKVFRENSQFNFKSLSVNYQYKSSFLTDGFLYYLKARYFRNNILRHILHLRESFSEYIKRNNIQLLHAHFALDGLYALSISTKCKVPLIVSLHGGYDTNVILNMRGFPKDEFFEKIDLFTVPSEHSKRNLISHGCLENKIRVLYHGLRTINTRQSDKKKEDTLIKLLLIGRMTQKKGIIDTITTFAELKKKHKNISLTIITGQKRRPCENLKEKMYELGFKLPFYSQLGYEKKVLNCIKRLHCGKEISIIRFIPSDDLRQLITEYDIFILPSRTAADGDEEGMPLALLEAQASGLPVVTTLHAGNPEAVIDGETGYVVPEGDIEEMIKRLEILVKNEELRITMGKEGQKNIEAHFSISRHIEHLEDIYNQVIKSYLG